MEEIKKTLEQILDALEIIKDVLVDDRCDRVCTKLNKNEHHPDCLFYMPQDDFQYLFRELVKRIDIITFAEKYVEYSKDLPESNQYKKSRCPFCTKDAMTFSKAKQVYYCFGCHQGGDVVQFYSKLKNISPVDAFNKLSKEFPL